MYNYINFKYKQNRKLHFITETIKKVKVKVTLRLTVSKSVSLGVEPHLGLMTRLL
jgi:hypothetical protein